MGDSSSERRPPFGTVYFGAAVTAVGVAVMGGTGAGGPAILVSGVLLVCTGMVLRALDRLR